MQELRERIPLLGFIRNRLDQRAEQQAEHQRKVQMAREAGARIQDEQQQQYFDSVVLSNKIREASQKELKGYIEEVWSGFFERGKEIAEEEQLHQQNQNAIT